MGLRGATNDCSTTYTRSRKTGIRYLYRRVLHALQVFKAKGPYFQVRSLPISQATRPPPIAVAGEPVRCWRTPPALQPLRAPWTPDRRRDGPFRDEAISRVFLQLLLIINICRVPSAAIDGNNTWSLVRFQQGAGSQRRSPDIHCPWSKVSVCAQVSSAKRYIT